MVFEPPKAYPVPVKMAFTQNKLPVADASSTASASESLFRDYQTNARFGMIFKLVVKSRMLPADIAEIVFTVLDNHLAQTVIP